MTEFTFPLPLTAVGIDRFPKEVADRKPSVRVFRSSPEHMTLQIRTAGGYYATASLPFDVALDIALAIKEETARR